MDIYSFINWFLRIVSRILLKCAVLSVEYKGLWWTVALASGPFIIYGFGALGSV